MSDQNDLFGGKLEATAEDILANMPDVPLDDSRWAQGTAQLIDVYQKHFEKRRNETPEQARESARQMVALLSVYMGGYPLYIPKPDRLEHELRDHKIWTEFNGHNHRELARRYQLTQASIYEIVDRQRKRYIGRIQPELELEESAA